MPFLLEVAGLLAAFAHSNHLDEPSSSASQAFRSPATPITLSIYDEEF